MRIALVTTSFLPYVGGAELAVHHLAQEWNRQGHEVIVLNNVADRPSAADAHYKVVRFPLARGNWRWGSHRRPLVWYETFFLGRALRRFQPDFISAHFGYPTAIWLARLRPIPNFTITDHGPALDGSPHGARRRFGIDTLVAHSLNQAQGVVALSRFARRVLESIGVDPGRIWDIPNGVEVDRFARDTRDFDVRARFGIAPSAPLVLSVGRSSWEKAYDSAVRAFAILRRLDDSSVHYLIVGHNTQAYRRLCMDLGVADRVAFCDGMYGDELVAAYRQADVFCMSSISEVCPLVCLEAMAAGLPQVVTDVGGCQDLVENNANGFVVPPGDPEALAHALHAVLSNSALRERMAAVNLARAGSYSWSRISREYLIRAGHAVA